MDLHSFYFCPVKSIVILTGINIDILHIPLFLSKQLSFVIFILTMGFLNYRIISKKRISLIGSGRGLGQDEASSITNRIGQI